MTGSGRDAVVLPPLWEDLLFLSPMSSSRADALATWVAGGLQEGGVVLDVGCGWAELLLRVLERAPGAHGVGTDLVEDRLEEGRRRAEARGLAHRARLPSGAGDVSETHPGPVDAALVVGASKVWARRRGGAAARLRRGPGRCAPPPDARRSGAVRRGDLVRLAADHGFAVVGVAEADLGEWDAFESGSTARAAGGVPRGLPRRPGLRVPAAARRPTPLGGGRSSPPPHPALRSAG